MNVNFDLNLIPTPPVDTDRSMEELFRRLDTAMMGELRGRMNIALQEAHSTVHVAAGQYVQELFGRLDSALMGELRGRMNIALQETHSVVLATASQIANEASRAGAAGVTPQFGGPDDLLMDQYQRVFAALAVLVGEERAQRIANGEEPPTGGETPSTSLLEWSKWYQWDDLMPDARHDDGIRVPQQAGVYEVKRADAEERLTIGRSTNLRNRIKQGLVRGNLPHAAGERIRLDEDTSTLVVRWAPTERHMAVEAELHESHRDKFGWLPKYTRRT